MLKSFTSNEIYEYLDGRTVEGLGTPPDTYRSRFTSGISKNGRPTNLERGLAIQRARRNKARLVNEKALIELLPQITFATPRDALETAQMIQRNELAVTHGWQYWQKDSAASWIHESELSKIARAKEMGATRTI